VAIIELSLGFDAAPGTPQPGRRRVGFAALVDATSRPSLAPCCASSTTGGGRRGEQPRVFQSLRAPRELRRVAPHARVVAAPIAANEALNELRARHRDAAHTFVASKPNGARADQRRSRPWRDRLAPGAQHAIRDAVNRSLRRSGGGRAALFRRPGVCRHRRADPAERQQRWR